MSSKFISILKITLLIILGMSIFYCWQFYQMFQADNQAITSTNINLAKLTEVLEEDSKIEGDNESSYTSTPRSKDWENIIANNFFDIKEVLDEGINQESLKENQPKTNLPGFLVKEEKKDKPFTLLAISKQNGNSRAIIADKSNWKSYILKEGMEIKDYLVQEIKEDEVILVFKDEEFRLNFSD